MRVRDNIQLKMTELVCVILACLMTLSLPGAASAGSAAPADITKERYLIRLAAEQYLDAEKNRDFEAVYRMLAPSSAYVQTHTYEEYRAEAEASPVRIIEYRVLTIAGIRENHDRVKYPDIQWFAWVEVELKLYYRDTGHHETVNFDFTFVKVGNRWFKG